MTDWRALALSSALPLHSVRRVQRFTLTALNQRRPQAVLEPVIKLGGQAVQGRLFDEAA